MLKNNSLISVIVPVYNTKAYLGKCIKTIIDQSYKNLEIILIDDGSTDGTSVMCDEWSQKDARIKVFHLQNGGVSKARNFALEQCHGEWVSFVDSDDWLALDMYEILLALADKFEADTACCGAWQGNEENYIVRNIWRRFKEDEALLDAPIVSVSLGLPATFQFGGLKRTDSLQRVWLEHGDVVVWGGESRLFYHAVLPLKAGNHPQVGPWRYNLTFRCAT